MKKQLFTILSAMSFGSALAQSVASPDWSTLQSPSFTIPIAGVRYVDAVDANVCWASGYDGTNTNLNYDFYTRTTNGGLSWTSGNIFPDTNTFKIANMEGIDANTAWVCSYLKANDNMGAIHRTTNGGASWQNMTAPGMFTNTTQSFGNWVTFLTPMVGVVNGDPIGSTPEYELWRTTDGGSTWTIVPGADIPNPTPNEFAIVDMYSSVGPSHVWFGTNQGRVYRSFDAGATWSVSNVSSITSATSSVIEVRFATPNNGLCLVFQNNGYGLYNTFDGGATWNLIPGGSNGVPNNYGINEMGAVPGTSYYVSAGNLANPQTFHAGLSYSKDNGVTWTDWGGQNLAYVSIDMADRWHGWAGGFTNVPDNNWPGIFKYDGVAFNSEFSIPQSVCIGSSNVTLTPVNTSSTINGPSSFSWSSIPAAQFSSASASVPVITFNSVGTYTVILSMTDQNGTSTYTQVIEVASCTAPTASFSMATVGCNNDFIEFENTSTGGPAPQVTITTTPSNNVVINGPTGNQYNLYFGDPGTYTVHMFASSISGTSSATQVVTINDCRPYAIFAMQDFACRKRLSGGNDTVYITPSVTSTAAVQNFTWSYSPVNPGITSFANTTPGPPPGKKLVLSSATGASVFTTYTITLKVGNAYGITEYSKVLNVTMDNCVGISEQGGWTSDVKLYPNPAHENLTLSLPSNGSGYTIRVINVLGAAVLEEHTARNSNEDVNLNVSGLRKGVYFVQIEAEGATATRKFIVD